MLIIANCICSLELSFHRMLILCRPFSSSPRSNQPTPMIKPMSLDNIDTSRFALACVNGTSERVVDSRVPITKNESDCVYHFRALIVTMSFIYNTYRKINVYGTLHFEVS